MNVSVKLGVKLKEKRKIDKGDVSATVIGSKNFLRSPSISSSSSTRSFTSNSTERGSVFLQALSEAQRNSYAIAAFNVYNLEGAKAAVDAAVSGRAPAVILQV